MPDLDDLPLRPTLLLEFEESTQWAVQVGCEGRWHTTTEWESDRASVVSRLAWLWSLASSSVSYRMACRRTSVTVVLEDA